MELGLDFDDEFFEEEKVESQKRTRGYEAKQCETEWFSIQTKTTDQDVMEEQNMRKFHADLCYNRGDIHQALGLYLSIRDNKQYNCSSTVERELAESVARSLMKLQRFDEAEKVIREMLVSQTDDASLWFLLAKVFAQTGHYIDEIKTLEKCIALHSFNHYYWFALAKANMKVHNINMIQQSKVPSKCICNHRPRDTVRTHHGKEVLTDKDLGILCCCHWFALAKANMKAHNINLIQQSKAPCKCICNHRPGDTERTQYRGKEFRTDKGPGMLCCCRFRVCKDCQGVIMLNSEQDALLLNGSTINRDCCQHICLINNEVVESAGRRCICLSATAESELSREKLNSCVANEEVNVFPSNKSSHPTGNGNLECSQRNPHRTRSEKLGTYRHQRNDSKLINCSSHVSELLKGMDLSERSQDCGISKYQVVGYVCLLRTRSLLNRSMWSSSSFVQDKAKTLLQEVILMLGDSDKLCHCAGLKSEILEQLGTEETDSSDLQESKLGLEERAKEFSIRWFGNVLQRAEQHACVNRGEHNVLAPTTHKQTGYQPVRDVRSHWM